jgi:hypothetical protein
VPAAMATGAGSVCAQPEVDSPANVAAARVFIVRPGVPQMRARRRSFVNECQ